MERPWQREKGILIRKLRVLSNTLKAKDGGIKALVIPLMLGDVYYARMKIEMGAHYRYGQHRRTPSIMRNKFVE